MPYDKQKVIDLAISQIGYYEKASNSQLDSFTDNKGTKNWTKYARDLDKEVNFYNGPKNGYAWCDIFVDWCFVKAYGRDAAQKLLCQPNKSGGAGCMYSAQYFNQNGQFHKKDPQPGDQIFFGDSWTNVWHTGLVVEVTKNYVVSVEGNTSDMVAKRSYSHNDNRIWGYGRPNWGSSVVASSPAVVVAQPTQQKTCSPKVPVLSKGDKNGYVKAAQILLGERGLYCGGKVDKVTKKEEFDGEFGETTKKSLMEFQKKAKITSDGIVGAETWAALLNL